MAKLVFDASAVIALFDSSNVHHSWALDVYRANGDADFLIPAITYAEILVHPAKAKKLQSFVTTMAKAGFEIVEIDRTTAENIAATRATTDLKMPDAIVLAIAQDVNGTLVSADKVLVSKAKSSKVKAMTPWPKL